ncbi:MAG: pyrimidine dimer DNA glycosylase/endonuclease V [Alphaproteobacteria bacterium]
MTRINLVPVEEISDQHLMAEYRELPRIVNGVIDGKLKIENIPTEFCLGKGHVKFFVNKIHYLVNRYHEIYQELKFRSYNLTLTANALQKKVFESDYDFEVEYIFTKKDIEVSKKRLIEKVSQKPEWYKWTKRKRPSYY